MGLFDRLLDNKIEFSDEEIDLANKLKQDYDEKNIDKVDDEMFSSREILKSLGKFKDYISRFVKDNPSFENDKKIKNFENYITKKTEYYQRLFNDLGACSWALHFSIYPEFTRQDIEQNHKLAKFLKKEIKKYKENHN